MKPRHTVYRKPAVTGVDALGNTTVSHGPVIELAAYGVAPHLERTGDGSMVETDRADIDIFMPKTEVATGDLFTVDGRDYRVVKVDDWTMGLTGWQPGIVVALKGVT